MVDLIFYNVIPLSLQGKYQPMIPVHLTFESAFAFGHSAFVWISISGNQTNP